MPSSSRSGSTGTRKLFSYVFRRQQCLFIVFLQLSIIFLLCTVAFRLYHRVGEQHQGCLTNDDDQAFIMKIMVPTKINNASVYNCAKRVDYIRCDFNDQLKFNIKRFKKFPQCPGFKGKILKNYISPTYEIFAPATDISKIKGQIARAKDIIMHCPKCVASTRFFQLPVGMVDDDQPTYKCVRQLRTTEMGWPTYASYCDHFEEHENQTFCKLDQAVKQAINARKYKKKKPRVLYDTTTTITPIIGYRDNTSGTRVLGADIDIDTAISYVTSGISNNTSNSSNVGNMPNKKKNPK